MSTDITHAAKPSRPAPVACGSLISRAISWAVGCFSRIPHSLIALLARLSIAAVFWMSGQTKVQGFVVNIITGDIHLGWPGLSDSVIDLFRDEYKLPFVSPEIAAPMAATAEHLFPLLLLIGLGTRFSALALLVMTTVIEVFVYPDAYPTHGTWAALLLYLMARGPGRLSIDHGLASRRAAAR